MSVRGRDGEINACKTSRSAPATRAAAVGNDLELVVPGKNRRSRAPVLRLEVLAHWGMPRTTSKKLGRLRMRLELFAERTYILPKVGP